MATSIAAIRERVQGLLEAPPFQFTRSVVPFDFSQVPTGVIDGAYRLETESQDVAAGMHYAETRVDRLRLSLAKKLTADADATYQDLLALFDDVASAVIRDGAQVSGEYAVLDAGRGSRVGHTKGQEFAVGVLTLPVNYEIAV
jgi:hypothetical protein